MWRSSMAGGHGKRNGNDLKYRKYFFLLAIVLGFLCAFGYCFVLFLRLPSYPKSEEEKKLTMEWEKHLSILRFSKAQQKFPLLCVLKASFLCLQCN